MRSLDELLDTDASAIQRLRQWAESAVVPCSLLPPSRRNADVLLRVQRPTSTVLGALAYETGGVLVDYGWLRFLGSGHPELPRNLADWNQGRGQGFLLVADDAAGGFFAVNEGAWDNEADSMYYWSPDNLDWEPIGFALEDFLQWSLTPYVADFYQNIRWPTWKQDVQHLTGETCFAFSPYLWTKKGSLRKSTRRAIPVQEAFDLKLKIATQSNEGGD